MIKLSHQQILNRFDSLPDILKDIGFSEQTIQIIRQVCEQNHLTDDKRGIVSQLVGYVLFGFIHAEDLAKEIRAELNLAPEIANSIATEIDRKIFAPIRTDLEKNYAPPAPEVTRVPTEPTVSPESVIDLKVSRVLAEAADDKQKVAEAPAPAEIPIAPQKMEPAPAEPPSPRQSALSPRESAPQEEAPVIIHKETEFRPTAGEATKRSLGSIFGLLTPKEKPTEAKPVTARIEMTGALKPETEEGALKPAPAAKPEPPKIRVVHYTELRTPFSPVETPAKPPVSPPTPPIIAPAQLQKEEIRKEVLPKIEPSVPSIGAVQGKPLDLTQGKPAEPVKMAESPKIPEPQKVAESLKPLETPKPFEPLRKSEPIKPFEPVKPFDVAQGKPFDVTQGKPVEPVKPPEPPKAMEPIKPAESPRPPTSPKPEEKKPEKPVDEGDIIDLRTFQKVTNNQQPTTNN